MDGTDPHWPTPQPLPVRPTLLIVAQSNGVSGGVEIEAPLMNEFHRLSLFDPISGMQDIGFQALVLPHRDGGARPIHKRASRNIMPAISGRPLCSSPMPCSVHQHCYHPEDYVEIAWAYEAEQSPAAKGAMAQILVQLHGGDGAATTICQDGGAGVHEGRVGRKDGHELRPSVSWSTGRPARVSARPAGPPWFPIRCSRRNAGDNTPGDADGQLVTR